MKELKINVPDGYYIDKEESTSGKIVFKKILDLTDSWEDIFFITGYYVNEDSEVVSGAGKTTNDGNRNIFNTKKQALASLALAQLSQLMDIYRQGWKPDWNDMDTEKWVVNIRHSDIRVSCFYSTNTFLSFQDEQTAILFRDNFRELIEEAKPLMS